MPLAASGLPGLGRCWSSGSSCLPREPRGACSGAPGPGPRAGVDRSRCWGRSRGTRPPCPAGLPEASRPDPALLPGDFGPGRLCFHLHSNPPLLLDEVSSPHHAEVFIPSDSLHGPSGKAELLASVPPVGGRGVCFCVCSYHLARAAGWVCLVVGVILDNCSLCF